jgi:hypothetical protein
MSVVVYEQILRLDVSMNDSLCMYVFNGYELAAEVQRMSIDEYNDGNHTSSAM